MSWQVFYTDDAKQDFAKLDGSHKILVQKAIKKVSQNPVSIHEGGYGKPLGNKNGTLLAGLFKIKLKAAGIRIVYDLINDINGMRIIIIGVRADGELYKSAAQRLNKIGK